MLVEVETPLKGSDYGALGYLVGKTVGNGIPYFKLKSRKQEKTSVNNLKALGAALASSGAVALYHVEKITPEYQTVNVNLGELEKISITSVDIAETRDQLSMYKDKPDLVCLGCPHASLEEIQEVAKILKGKTLANELWVCTSISVKAASDRMGYTKIIEKAGGQVVCDTCMVVAPIEEMDFKVMEWILLRLLTMCRVCVD